MAESIKNEDSFKRANSLRNSVKKVSDDPDENSTILSLHEKNKTLIPKIIRRDQGSDE